MARPRQNAKAATAPAARPAEDAGAFEALAPGVDGLVGPVDLAARVVYFPVRHHSPACAWHVSRLIRRLKPSAVLIEGPRDATPLIPLLTAPAARMPLAVYTTYVQRREEGPPTRHGAYYPLCDYSPELAAIRAAREVEASARFIDLTFPEMVRAEAVPRPTGTRSLLGESHLRHSRVLRAACVRAGVRDPDDLWDHLYEVDYEHVETATFVRRVLTYCALARSGQSAEMLEADGTLARERAMAAAVAEAAAAPGPGPVVVVAGGFHAVALASTPPQMPEPMKLGADDAVTVLMRYGFEQLDRLNGYASGMPSPEFYQRRWEGRGAGELIVELGRACRGRRLDVSVADEIAAVDQCQRLARLRGHATPSREDVLDGVRSSLTKGAADSEGLMVLALARKLFAGSRVGEVPKEAGQPPLVHDFRDSARRLRIDLDRVDSRETVLDLYRRTAHREASRFFHRLRFLEVPFAELVRGPDFVAGTDLERIQEAWTYHWSPRCESALVERSLYGASLEEAAAGLLTERFGESEARGTGRRADVAATLLLEACRMGLHRHTPDLLRRVAALVSDDAAFVSLMGAISTLISLHVSREPLEAHHLSGVVELARLAYDRACYLIPQLASTSEADESAVLDGLNALSQAARTLEADAAMHDLRWRQLGVLADAGAGNAAVRGAAAGLLYGEGRIDSPGLARRVRGTLFGAAGDGEQGAAYLRGVLVSARSALWQVPELVADLHELIGGWDEDRFVKLLPHMRLAFSALTPRECDRVARAVAAHAGVEKLEVATSDRFGTGDVVHAAGVQRRLVGAMRRDGLERWAEPSGEKP